jgi:hypothetical protein
MLLYYYIDIIHLDGKWDKSKIDTKGKKIRFDLYPGAELKKSK